MNGRLPRRNGPHLPDLTDVVRLFRQLHRREYRDGAVGRLIGGEVPCLEREAFDGVDALVGGEIVSVDPNGSVEFVGDEGLGTHHASAAGVDSPRHPAVGSWRRGSKGDGERVVGGVEGEVECGAQRWEFGAVGVGAVRWELLGGAGEGGRVRG